MRQHLILRPADLSDLEKSRGKSHGQDITWERLFKVRSSACLWPLWAGVAEPAQARRIVREHVMIPGEFLSEFGGR